MMVAFDFDPRFEMAIREGWKTQTIRKPRFINPRPGALLQLFTGLRTPNCRRICDDVRCTDVLKIEITFGEDSRIDRIETDGIVVIDLDAFAVRDGFEDIDDMAAFFKLKHGPLEVFKGLVIEWSMPRMAAGGKGGGGMKDPVAQSCPACGSDQVIFSEVTLEACACGACGQLFVAEHRADPTTQLCDDCAFRPGSPERQDGYKWAEIIQATIVDQIHPFHCHKGLACELRGGTLHYLRPEEGQRQLTPCAGWRAHLLAYQAGTPARKL